jgi:hypothetical protein
MIEISATWVVWVLFGVMCFCTSFCVAILAQFGDDEKKTLTVSTVFASTCTALYLLFISGILKIVN